MTRNDEKIAWLISQDIYNFQANRLVSTSLVRVSAPRP